MIGADEHALCNRHGCVIIVRRGADAKEAIDTYRQRMAEAGISIDEHPEDIRHKMWAIYHRNELL